MNRLIGLLATLTLFFSGCVTGETSNQDGNDHPTHSQERERNTSGGGRY
jgi:PBP1b-binding outer membrane lipoprotein LpoB